MYEQKWKKITKITMIQFFRGERRPIWEFPKNVLVQNVCFRGKFEELKKTILNNMTQSTMVQAELQ